MDEDHMEKIARIVAKQGIIGMQRSGLWVECPGTNGKRVHKGNRCLLQCPNTKCQTCTRAHADCGVDN